MTHQIFWEAELRSVLQNQLKWEYNKAEGRGNSRREKGFHKSRQQQEIGQVKKGKAVRIEERWDKVSQ